ncbi:hypothetical protein [Rummeliibacillus stabekisii]|uniref:hypothetical protein n=1 Tax=Rummeliibacillus stabekisii TaxID=241244 RepID=UPI0011749069|nr:hypothetical protein [Rummeliibacillus stabekisii]MBB5171577.1 hypothetical protein [Rummeliibacillus stabekisii]GEL05545.1 hypothetical protein RST01_21720 [Rummeliibacillus stabekisii]
MTVETGVSKETVEQLLTGDPLYEILEDTPKQEILLNDDYLTDIVEKSFYPITEVANWFGISDGQARYYLKPFHSYVFDGEEEDIAALTNSLRLNLKSILKLRMIILLKDEYKVKGLERLLGLSPILVTPKKERQEASNVPEVSGDSGKISYVTTDMLFELLRGLTDSGQFEVEQTEDNKMRIVPTQQYNQQYLLENIDGHIEEKVKSALREKETNAEKTEVRVQKALEETDKEVQTLKKQNQRLKEQLYEQRNFEEEALNEWEETMANNYGFLDRILKSKQIEIDKRKFINNKVMERLKQLDDR